jgi:hypothetical protein
MKLCIGDVGFQFVWISSVSKDYIPDENDTYRSFRCPLFRLLHNLIYFSLSLSLPLEMRYWIRYKTGVLPTNINWCVYIYEECNEQIVIALFCNSNTRGYDILEHRPSFLKDFRPRLSPWWHYYINCWKRRRRKGSLSLLLSMMINITWARPSLNILVHEYINIPARKKKRSRAFLLFGCWYARRPREDVRHRRRGKK